MSLNVRMGVSSFDAMLSFVRINHPEAETVIVSWDRKHRSAAVMGLLGIDGQLLDQRPDAVALLTSLLASPMHPDVLRLAYPDADLLLSGQVSLSIPVDEPTWARVLDNVELRIQAGLRVATDDIEDAAWATLEAAGLPNGSVTLERRVMFPELPDDIVFEPVWLSTQQQGAGEHLAWVDGTKTFPTQEITRALMVLLNELAVRHERETNMAETSNGKLVLTSAVVSL
ncbi:MAG: hypothetical protein J0J04_07835 [Microbacterium sp.]|uniref:hypothetical protein n=1 Tax=Microbacterium sp. TaxID=51671 RepID=UPI001AC6C20F|nr:hypothetical protein [Microbacterium sp.]MBN9214709.1 hypothetical protein [Microbacterium sp.]